MAQEQIRIVIVGAGFSGLTTAFELQERLPEAEITILETQSRAGGMLWSQRLGEYLVELGTQSLSGNRLSTMRLCQRLGLTDQLLRPSATFRKRWILHQDGEIHRVPTTLTSALTSPLFDMGSAFRLMTERLRPSGAGKNKHDESVYQFVERRLGVELAKLIGDAATTDQFAGDPRAISIRSGFSKYARAELEYGNVLGGLPRLRRAEREAARKAGITVDEESNSGYSFAEGMGTLIGALQSKLRQPVILNMGAQRIERSRNKESGRWVVHCSDGTIRSADIVILTCPAYKQAAMVADLDVELADTLLNIPYAGVVNIALGYQHAHVPKLVESHSLLVPQRFKRDLLRISFPSSCFPGRAPSGHVLMQITLGGWNRKELLVWEDDALILSARKELRNLLRITKPPEFFHLVRWPKAIPQYTLGHSQRVSQIETMLKSYAGLFLGGNAYYGVTLHECATQAERMARQVRDHVKAGK